MQSGQSGASRGDETMQWYGLRNVKKKKWVQILWVIKYKCNGDRNKGVELFVPSHGWTPPPPPIQGDIWTQRKSMERVSAVQQELSIPIKNPHCHMAEPKMDKSDWLPVVEMPFQANGK